VRILLVHNRYRSEAPSGENRVVDQESAALRAAGHTVERFERYSDDIAHWPARRRATVPAQVVWSDRSRRDLRTMLRRFRPDVVHLHNTFPLLSPSVLYACRQERVPVVATLHNYKLLCASGDFFRDGAVCHDCAGGSPAPALAHGCYRGSAVATTPIVAGLLAHRLAWRRLVSAYICISDAQRGLLAGLELPADRVFVKWNMSSPAVGENPAKKLQVAYIGRLDAAKGIPLLMAGWDRYVALASQPGLRLVVAGDGPLGPDLRSWAAGRSDIDVLGVLDRAGCAAVTGSSLAVLLPSQWEETFGLVATEAMAAGTAPIAAAHGAFTELITPDINGSLFTPGDSEALAAALADVEANPDRYTELGRRAQETYDARLMPDRNVADLLSIYQFAIDDPRFDRQRV
jgi:glycosyltransferase involved in cell wall biosynthesis